MTDKKQKQWNEIFEMTSYFTEGAQSRFIKEKRQDDFVPDPIKKEYYLTESNKKTVNRF